MTSSNLDEIINSIKTELDGFTFKPSNLVKFKPGNAEDAEYLTYANGVGGAYVKFLAILTKKLQPKNIVELGNREGLSTFAFYDQLPANSTFTTIDIIEDVRYCPDEMFTDPRVNFITGDVASLDVLKQVPDNIDILFTDTIHFYFQLKDEFEIYQHLLADTAIVAIDDIRTNDKGKFWAEVTHPKWDLTEVCHHSGWGLFLYERKVPKTREERWNAILEATSRIWERKYQELFVKDEARTNSEPMNVLKKKIKENKVLYKTILGVKKALR
jgi:predicted O-methyltransferase YrrM